MRKIDYIKKGQLIAQGLPQLVGERSYMQYRLMQYGDAVVTMYYKCSKNKFAKVNCNTLNNIYHINTLLANVPNADILECERINHAKYTRNKRLNDKLCKLVELSKITQLDMLFVTFTFNDNSLNNLNARVRRQYVAEFLKNNSLLYVGNIDFGEEYGREHYHAVCVGNLDFKQWHKYGAIKVEHIKLTKYCGKVLAKYITKLTNHAIKECSLTKSNKRQVLLYQKGFDKEYYRLIDLFSKNSAKNIEN